MLEATLNIVALSDRTTYPPCGYDIEHPAHYAYHCSRALCLQALSGYMQRELRACNLA